MTKAMPADKFYFVGVSTGQSMIMTIFPRWAAILGINAEIRGYDLPLHAPPASYRRLVKAIRDDPTVHGALVTTHKIDVLHACRDLFDGLDGHAELCDEVSCITNADGRLLGAAMDEISSGLVLDHFVPTGHWDMGKRDVLCLGAGGAAIAISVCLARRSRQAGQPRRFVCVDILPERLKAIREIHQRLDTSIVFDYHLNREAAGGDELMHELPAGSLVINATGKGKDRPGSPISDAALFPHDGMIWELSYRGERQFLRQARAQAEERNLAIADGWLYFLHGWTQAIAEIFDLEFDDGAFNELSNAAADFRR